MLETLLAIWLFLLGLSIGSFLNVVIARLPVGESLVHPRSHCPRCGHQLPWYENIPVFSWLALKGRCSSCQAPISPRYLLVELLTGLLFVACLARLGWRWPLAGALTFVSILLPLIFIDAERYELPAELTGAGVVLGLAFRGVHSTGALLEGVAGVVVGFLAFRLVELVGWAVTGKEAMGAGDKHLLAMVGATLGWRPLLGVVMLSALQGAVYGVVQLRRTGRAGPPPLPRPEDPAPAEPPPDGGEPPRRLPWTPAFRRPGLPPWRRARLVPYALLWQDIPDPPPPEAPGWTPHPSELPFGPWIGLAALELLLAGPALVAWARHTPFSLTAQVLFGG